MLPVRVLASELSSSNNITGLDAAAGNVNGAPSTSQGQFEGIAAANTLPASAEQMGAADPMALVLALQALPKVSADDS